MLALGWIVPPGAWLLTLELDYLLARWICATGHRWILSAVALFAMAAVGASASAVLLDLRFETAAEPRSATRQFLGMAALLLSAMSLLGLVAFSVPGWILQPCD